MNRNDTVKYLIDIFISISKNHDVGKEELKNPTRPCDYECIALNEAIKTITLN